jgi:hypothetical protein
LAEYVAQERNRTLEVLDKIVICHETYALGEDLPAEPPGDLRLESLDPGDPA